MVDVTREVAFPGAVSNGPQIKFCTESAGVIKYVAGWLPFFFDSKHALARSKSLSLPSRSARSVSAAIARELIPRRATMSKVGILPVPEGETSEFDGFSELQVRILVVYIVTSALATVGLILRFYTGACLNQRRLGPDACTSEFPSQLHHHLPPMCRSIGCPGVLGSRLGGNNSARDSRLTQTSSSSYTGIVGSLPSLVHWHVQGLPLWIRETSMERYRGAITMLHGCESKIHINPYPTRPSSLFPKTNKHLSHVSPSMMALPSAHRECLTYLINYLHTP